MHMKIGVIGTGFMGSTHASAWKKTGADIVGFLADPPSEARQIAQQYEARAFSSLEELIESADVVDICSPTHLHSEMAIAAARAGKHIVCEKPLARTVEQGEAMLKACRTAGVRLFVAHVVRYFPEYALAAGRVQAGDIGKVGTAQYRRLSYRPKKPVGNWFLDEEKSGGILLDLMIHDFDIARWIAGDVVSVHARKVTSYRKDSPADYGMVILVHASGALSHVAGAWAYPPPVFRTGFEICGDGGIIQHDSDSESPIEALTRQGTSEAPDVGLPASPLAESPYDLEIADFYRCLTEGGEPRVSAEDGLAALKIACAAIESAKTGQAVELEPRGERGEKVPKPGPELADEHIASKGGRR
jgi:predicted dehydrogenase